MILGIYGSSGMGREVRELAILINSRNFKKKWKEIIFIDDTKEVGSLKGCMRLPFSEIVNNYKQDELEIVICVGEPSSKFKIYEKIKRYGYSLCTLIHPDAEISPSADIGNGVVVRKGTIVSSDSKIGKNVILQSNVIIGHDAKIGDHCQISSFSEIAGNCDVGNEVFVGIGSFIKENTSIGDQVIVSMGSVVMKNINSGDIVMGNPARLISKNNEKKVFK